MNFHIFSAYNSEISSEFRIDARKKFGIVRIDRRKKFGIDLIFRMTPEKNLELSEYSELTPKKNLELSKYPELRSETTTLICYIDRFGDYSELALRKFPH